MGSKHNILQKFDLASCTLDYYLQDYNSIFKYLPQNQWIKLDNLQLKTVYPTEQGLRSAPNSGSLIACFMN
jgi:hypothetical protein